VQTVVIGTYDLPAESKQAFLELIGEVQDYLRTLPGFVEDLRCQRGDEGQDASGDDGGGAARTSAGAAQVRCRIVTVAVWEDEEAYKNAAEAVSTWNRQRGVDTQALAKAMGVVGERVVFRRLPD